MCGLARPAQPFNLIDGETKMTQTLKELELDTARGGIIVPDYMPRRGALQEQYKPGRVSISPVPNPTACFGLDRVSISPIPTPIP